MHSIQNGINSSGSSNEITTENSKRQSGKIAEGDNNNGDVISADHASPPKHIHKQKQKKTNDRDNLLKHLQLIRSIDIKKSSRLCNRLKCSFDNCCDNIVAAVSVEFQIMIQLNELCTQQQRQALAKATAASTEN